MAEPFVGEIRQAGFNFAPPGWLLCQGQVVPISQFDILFTLIGTAYGGDGVSTFGIPDLRGRVTIDQGQNGGGNYTLGQMRGSALVTLTQSQMAAHTHVVRANSGMGTVATPDAGSIWAQVTPDGVSANTAYTAPQAADTTMAATAVLPVGSGVPVDVRQPYLVINFMIATEGIYPSS